MHESSQGRLDAYLFNKSESLSTEIIESRVKVSEKPLGVDWFK